MNQTTSTRESIIETAHRLLLQRGMNGFSYRDIAEPLGVKNAAVHYHFPSKMDLVEALIRDNHDVLRKSTAEFMAYGGPARPQLEGLFQFNLKGDVHASFQIGAPSSSYPLLIDGKSSVAVMLNHTLSPYSIV